MNKRFKFRIWHTETKQMVYFNIGENCISCCGYDEDGNSEHWTEIDINDYQIMQFTGLTDKNGIEIFEGDICKITDLEFIDFVDNGISSPDEKYEDGIVKIFFDEGGFCFNHPNTDTPCPIFYNIKETEVIGNVHDNPELLK